MKDHDCPLAIWNISFERFGCNRDPVQDGYFWVPCTKRSRKKCTRWLEWKKDFDAKKERGP